MTLHTGSINAQEQIRAREKPQAVLMLVTLSPPGFSDIRLVNNLTDITSNGNVFKAFPISVNLSADDGETLQTAKLTIDNVTLEMIDWVRAVVDPIPVIIQTIFSGSPDIIEQQLSDLVLRQITYDSTTIVGSLFADDDLNQMVPSDTYNSRDFAGLF